LNTDRSKVLQKVIFGHDELREVITIKELREYLCSEVSPCSMWGVAPTGILHFGFDRLIVKQWDLLSAKFKHTILIADIHTLFERGELEDLNQRVEYYIAYFKYLGKLSDAIFKLGSSFQVSEEYIEVLYRALACTSFQRAKRSLPSELKNGIPRVSVIVYPIAQAIDPLFLKSQIVYASIGQRRVYTS